MKLARLLVPVAALSLIALAGCHNTQKDTSASAGMLNSKCPMTGEPVDTAATTDYQGGKVAFCCNGCKGKWEKKTDQEKAALLNKAK